MTKTKIDALLNFCTDLSLPLGARLLWVCEQLAAHIEDANPKRLRGLFETPRSFYRMRALLKDKCVTPASKNNDAGVTNEGPRRQNSVTWGSLEKVPQASLDKNPRKRERVEQSTHLSDARGKKGSRNSKVPRTQGCYSPLSLNKKEDQTCVQKKVGGKTKSGQQKTRPPSSDKMLKWRTMAELLCRTVQDVDGFRYWKHLPKWENQFRAIHAEDGVPTPMLWDVLKWYCAQRVAKKASQLPKCVTANMFRGAFGWIKDRWEKDAGSLRPPDELWIAAAERSFTYSDFDKTQITFDALSRLYNLIYDWSKAAEANIQASSLRDCDKHFLLEVLNCRSDGATLPEQLGNFLFKRIENWSDWGGSMSAFRPGGIEFTAFLQRRAKDVWETRLTTKQLDILLQGACAKKAD
jgi:hypothetical protein